MSVTAKKNSPIQDFAAEINNTVNKDRKIVEQNNVADTTINETTQKPTQKKEWKRGRKSLGNTKRTAFILPTEQYNLACEVANLFFKGSLSSYIRHLIAKDLEENLDEYLKTAQFIQTLSD